MTTKYLTVKELESELKTPISFASSLKSERLSREMTRKEFSKLLGISIQSLADIEHSRRIPSPERALKIATQIGEPIAWWVQLSLQDHLREKKIDLNVLVS